MTYEEMGMMLVDFVNEDGRYSTLECYEKILFILNQEKKKEAGVNEFDTRSLPDLMQLVQTLPANLNYTDSALALASLQLFITFALKLVDKLKELDLK